MISAAIWELIVAAIGRAFGANGEYSRRTRDKQPRTERWRRTILALAFFAVSTLIIYGLVSSGIRF